MGRRVIWAYAAEADLEAVAEYIHRDSPAYAAAFLLQALEAGRSLTEFAERGHILPEFKDKKIRQIFVQSYRLIYLVEDDRVSIVALIHGRRDFRTAWDERDRELASNENWNH
ncbi:MAG: type II toxin-antitoxin system RelE/ParE family toxin [Desulfatiglandaceae bacterium]